MFDAAILVHGLGTADVASAVLRVTLGAFFTISGYHKLFNPDRRASLAENLKSDGVYSRAAMWAVPLGELLGGLGVLFGALTLLAAFGLIAICVGVLVLEGPGRVRELKPLDPADVVDDWLYLPETLYIVMLVVLILIGPGAWSVDALAARLL
jgi:putative oxidoreductase